MFVATVMNFLLSSLNAGSVIAAFVFFIRRALVLNIDYPLSGKPQLVSNTPQTKITTIISLWTQNIPVNEICRCQIPCLIVNW